MESCMMKPEEKKKTKSKLPPWPPETSKNEAEILEKPTPVVPPRPKYNELSQTQYRLKRLETNGEAGPTVSQTETKEKKPEPPVPAPRRAEQERNRTSRHSQRDSDDKRISAGSAQSDASDDPKQTRPSRLTAKLQKSLKDKKPTFISHVTDDQDRGDDAPDKRASANKPGVLKGVMKHLRSGPKVAGGEAAPEADKDDAASEKERPAGDKAKHDKSSESKQEFGSLLTGMFRKPPVVTVGNVDSDSEANEDDEKPSERSNAGGIFNGIFKKKPAEGPQPDEEQPDSGDNLSQKSSSEEKGGFFGGILRKSPKIPKETPAEQDAEELRGNLSGSSDSLSENKEKGGLFSGFLKKTPKVGAEESTLAQKEMSASDDSLSDAPKAKEKGSAFGGMFKKSPRPADSEEPQDDERSVGGDGASEENKEKGGIFAGFFKKAAKAPQSEQDESEPKKLSASSENLAEGKAEKDRARFGGFFKKTPKGDRLESSDGEEDDEQPAAAGAKGDDDDAPKTANKDKNLFSNMFKKPPKPAEGDKEAELKSEGPTSGSSENLPENVPKGKKGGLAGIFKRTYSSDKLVDEDKEKSASNDNLLENANAKDKEKSIFSGIFKKAPKLADEAVVDEDSKGGEEKKLLASDENLTEENTAKEKSGGLAGMFKKSPQPAPRSIATKDPLSDDREAESVKDDLSGDELSGSSVNLVAGTAKEKKGVFTSMFKRTPKTVDKEVRVRFI
ncbi:nucleolar protein dao-5-like [Syngnathoides biaculeatus]|uniref:nucleolar protein dao-5-like n=1 Tax=Syngnathoides biaculeatus TaxID=300417 RepID=UPI002ADE4909|nr:nucleolar protein dao-5-like [Syngnathoides biaculeatus]